MDPRTQKHIDELIHKPHGILLVTGPTGSGKTTTLYAALERINDNTRNIMTVEDPIEYYIDGIGQTQVNTKVEMTFARGLRAILRQDPDVVMVGEIRDLETAQIAVQASLTGHLVLSTLHTNTAVGAVTRLRDMGVEPFLLSSSLIGVLAQRLVRVLNPDTKRGVRRRRVRAPAAERARTARPRRRCIGPAPTATQGFKGRTGIYELVLVDDAHAHDDPRRRERAGARALRAHADAQHPRRRSREDPRRRDHDRRSAASVDARGLTRAPPSSSVLMGAFEYTRSMPPAANARASSKATPPAHVRQLLRDQSLLPVAVNEVAQTENRQRAQALSSRCGAASPPRISRC